MAAKTVSILIEGSGRPAIDVTLVPGSTVRDAITKAGLRPSDVCMSSPDGQRLLAPDEDLFNMADPGDQYSVSPAMRAGLLEESHG